MHDFMIKREDYTSLLVGTKIGKGTVKLCPTCQKAGIATQHDGVTFFVHAEWVGRDEDGHLQAGWVEHIEGMKCST